MKTNGVYLTRIHCKIILIKDVEHYERGYSTPAITLCTWIDGTGEYKKTAIKENQFDIFIRLGDL